MPGKTRNSTSIQNSNEVTVYSQEANSKHLLHAIEHSKNKMTGCFETWLDLE